MLKLNAKLLAFVAYFVLPAGGFAQSLEDDIAGFTTDNTITRVGHEFARYISHYRNSLYPESKYNLSVYERPSARWGNLIWVEKDHKTVFRRFMSPNRSGIESEAKQAVIQIHKEVKQLELKELFSDTFDIDKDEI